MSKKEKKTLARILISTALFLAALLIPSEGMLRFALFLPSYILIGWDVLWKALRNILRGHVFDENFLMGLATIGAFALGEYVEGVAVMLFYQVGELFQSYAVGRSRRSIAELMDIRPDYANIMRDGELVRVSPEEVKVGELITVKAGERIPLDGIVQSGTALSDTSALTGESVPRELTPGSEALSGCINLNGLLTIEVSKEYSESTVSKILDLVENASSKKARVENFITRFARYYTPIVVFAAVALAFLPPLILQDGSLSDWVYRALTFLVISCPCALVISVPLGFFGGIGGASKLGILVKGSNYLEALSRAETVVFDKTGTLTKGTFSVTKLIPKDVSEQELLEYAALAEGYSDHPIALSLKQAYGKEIDSSRIGAVEEIAGHGVKVAVDQKEVLCGNARLLKQHGIAVDTAPGSGTVVHTAVDGRYIGAIVISDEIKADAKKAIFELKHKQKVKNTVMLTGDIGPVAEAVGSELQLDQVYSQLLPADKVEKVETLLTQKSQKGTLIFVGDGINDAPVLSRADVGVAMGGLGSDAAIEAADVVIMDDKPSKLGTAIGIARRTMQIVKQNIVFALGVKFLVLIFAAFGAASMWMGIFADVGVSVLAILNSMRALNVRAFQQEDRAAPLQGKPQAPAVKAS